MPFFAIFPLGLDTSLALENYRGSGRKDQALGASLNAEYSLNRWTQFIASVSHERRNSNEAGSSYSANMIEMGIKFQP